MKKFNLIGLTAFFVLVMMFSVMAAPSMPHPVYGKVETNGVIIPFQQVQLTICDFRKSTIDNCVPSGKCIDNPSLCLFDTDRTGSYIFELANINPGYREGDLIRIKACEGHSNCEVILELTDTATQVNFNIGVEKQVVEVENTVEIEKIVEVPVKSDNGEDIFVKVAGIQVTIDELKNDMKNYWFKGFIAMIIALSAGLGITKAFKMLRTRMTKIKKK